MKYFNFVLFLISVQLYSQAPFYKIYDTDDGLPSTEFYDVIEDGEGYLWFTSDKGIVRYDYYEFEVFTLEDGLANNVNFTFYKETQNTFWVNSIDGNFTFWNGEKFIPFRYNDEIQKWKSSSYQWYEIIYTDKDYIYFVSGIRLSNQYYRINKNTGDISEVDKNVIYKLELKGGAKTQRLLKMLPYRDLIDTDNAIESFNTKTIFYFTEPRTISSNEPFNIVVNEVVSGDSLFVLADNGIYIYDKIDGHFIKGIEIQNSLISSAIFLTSGDLWVTSASLGIIHIPNIKVEIINSPINKLGNIAGLLATDEILYIKSRQGHIHKLFKNGQFVTFPSSGTENIYAYKSNYNNKVYFGGISFDDKKPNQSKPSNIIFVNQKYEFKYSGGSIQIKKINSNNMKSIKKKMLCYFISEKDQILYFGSLDGLFYIDLIEALSTEYPHLVDGSKNIRINTLEKFGDFIVVGTYGGGLYFYKDKIFEKISLPQLNNSTIQSLKLINNDLWVGTNAGIYLYEIGINNNKISLEYLEKLTVANGLLSNYITDIEYWKDSVWIGTNKGLCKGKVEDFSKNHTFPTIRLNSIVVNDSVINHKAKNSFDYLQNKLEFSFTGISQNKSTTFYSYRLNKFGNSSVNWKATDERSVIFDNLNPGEYEFEVFCKDIYQRPSNIATYKFKIKPHYSQTFLFRTILFGIGMLLFYLALKYRNNQIQKKLKLDLKLGKAEIAVIRNQINPHFFFNALNALQYFIYSNKKKEAGVYLGMLSKLIRKSLLLSRKEYCTIEEEISYVKQYLDLEKLRFGDKFDFDIKYNINDKKTPSNIPTLLTQPIIENCIKHGFKNIDYKGLIYITYNLVQDRILIEIEDNGCGFEGNIDNIDPNQSLGLTLVKNRLALLNELFKTNESSIKFQTKENSGSLCIINLPIIK